MPHTQIVVKYHNTTKWDNPNEERPKNFQVVAEDGGKYSYDKSRAKDWDFKPGATRLIIWEEQPGINGGNPWNLIEDVVLQPPSDNNNNEPRNPFANDVPFEPTTNGSGSTQHYSSPEDELINEIHCLYKKCFQLVSTEPDFQDFSMEQKGTTATTYFITASRSKQ